MRTADSALGVLWAAMLDVDATVLFLAIPLSGSLCVPLPSRAARTSSVNSTGAECFGAESRFAIYHHTYISTIDVLPSTTSSLKSTRVPPPFAVAARINKSVVFERRSHLRHPSPSTHAHALSVSLIAQRAVIRLPHHQ